MKEMARVGQFMENKDGVSSGGRRRRIGTRGYARRKVVFVLDLRQETECLVGRE